VVAADLALAAEDAVAATGYIHLGTSPDGGLTATLGRVVGLKQAAGDAFSATGSMRDARSKPASSTAWFRRGPSRPKASRAAARLANGPTHAYGRTKALLQATLGDARRAAAARDRKFCRMRRHPEFVEGSSVLKRRPNFSCLQ
jgi:2-(1,2-epoxy-1,2-dihydrophenyl)acetyl-CoA isomerase